MRDALASLVAALDESGADWYLFGAQAAILHGSVRLSDDIDITAWAPDRAKLIESFARHHIAVDAGDANFVQRTRMLGATHTPSGWDIDIVFGAPGLEEHVLARAEWQDLDGLRIRVASAEDVIVMKCIAGRDKDRQDVVAILIAQHHTLDMAYVRDLVAQLREALAEDEIERFYDDALTEARRVIATE